MKAAKMQPIHLTPETALDFLEHRLDNNHAFLWQQHLKDCARCMQYLAEWQHLLVVIRRTNLKSAPQKDVEWVAEMVTARSDDQRLQIRCIFATKIFDSFGLFSMAGARGGPAPTRDIILQAEDFDIHVQIHGEGDDRQILGQILSRSRADFANIAQFHLLRDGERIQAAAADKLGEFHFTDVPEGNLRLQVDLPNLTIIGALNIDNHP
jgi:hypothetical protein